ncbi:MAG: hypothetical protein EXR66_05485 [Dehalococcoidia bacterium]|nr:hypothetical protein [Dehalococcoidia bacterium]
MPLDFDRYEELEVSRNASDEVIQAAFRRLARKFHPDSGESPDAARMAPINVAYESIQRDASARRACQARSSPPPPDVRPDPREAARTTASQGTTHRVMSTLDAPRVALGALILTSIIVALFALSAEPSNSTLTGPLPRAPLTVLGTTFHDGRYSVVGTANSSPVTAEMSQGTYIADVTGASSCLVYKDNVLFMTALPGQTLAVAVSANWSTLKSTGGGVWSRAR